MLYNLCVMVFVILVLKFLSKRIFVMELSCRFNVHIYFIKIVKLQRFEINKFCIKTKCK